jgi:hypothetical protein
MESIGGFIHAACQVSHLSDQRVLSQYGFHFGWRNVLTATQDHIFGTVHLHVIMIGTRERSEVHQLQETLEEFPL